MSKSYAKTSGNHCRSETVTICFLQEEDLLSTREELNILHNSFSPQFVYLTSSRPILHGSTPSSFEKILNQLKQAKEQSTIILIKSGKFHIIAKSLLSFVGLKQLPITDYLQRNSQVKKVCSYSFNEDECNVVISGQKSKTCILQTVFGIQRCAKVEVKRQIKQTKKLPKSHFSKQAKDRVANEAKVYQANVPCRKRKVTTVKSPQCSSTKKRNRNANIVIAKELLRKSIKRKKKGFVSKIIVHKPISYFDKEESRVIQKNKTKVDSQSRFYTPGENKHVKVGNKPPKQDAIYITLENGKKKLVNNQENEICSTVSKKKKDDSDESISLMIRERTNIPFSKQHQYFQVIQVYPAKRVKRLYGSGPVSFTEKLPVQVSERERTTELPPRDQIVTSSLPEKCSIQPTTNSMSYSSEQVVKMRLEGIPARSRPKGPPPVARHPHFTTSAARRNSFNNWPQSTHQDSSRMVDYGFFFTGRLDLIRCFQCGIGLKDWSEPDEPLFEHIKHSPDCPFLLKLLGEDLLSAYKVNLVPGSAQPAVPRPPPVEDPRESQGATGGVASNVRAPELSDLAARMRTFIKWSRDLTQTPLELAEAGFYYTGEGDICRCFTCDGGLTHWDPQDDPWIQHAKWFPSCTYVRQVKGNEFVSLIQQAIASTDDEETTNTGRETDVIQGLTGMTLHPTVLLDTPAAQAALDMGFSRKAVQLAISELTSANKPNFSSQDIVEILTRKQDAGETLPVDTPPNGESEQTENRNSEQHGEILCVKCGQRKVGVMFIPCAHHRYCEICAESVSRCPVCQTFITEKVKTVRA